MICRPRGAILAAAVAVLSLAGCTPPAAADHDEPTTVTARVVSVVDGDTINVEIQEARERVRLIGVDTPEIARDGGSDECYAQQARDYLDQLVYGRDVELISDPTQGDRDRYGRLLRHVIVDGRSAALLAIEAGVGTEYTFSRPYDMRSDYLAAQDRAKEGAAGLWAACR